MLFHSQVFVLIFLPVVLAGYYGLARQTAIRQWFLIAASLLFYGWWDARFLPLIVSQAVVSWLLVALYLRVRIRGLMPLAIVANLAVLGLYKYLDFLISIVEDATGLTLPRAELILPIGISFYTFQIVGYLIDVWRGDAIQYSLRRFVLFVVLFPQLIAGPIVRHNEIIWQFDADPLRQGWGERLSKGMALFFCAAAAKVLLADRLAVFVDPVYAGAATGAPDLQSAWFAFVAFPLQIFFDFAAYSEMAIGLGLMLGLQFPTNFAQPYRSLSLAEYWRRWHMTLSRFVRDYLYIPLGGSREGYARYLIAVVTTMTLMGLWHGAGWTYVIWGALHGVGLAIGRTWGLAKLPMPAILGWIITLLYVMGLFVIFRAPDLNIAFNMYQGLFGTAGAGDPWSGEAMLLVAVAGALALAPFTFKEAVDRWLVPARWAAVSLAVLAVYIVLEVGKGQPKSFIYFQF